MSRRAVTVSLRARLCALPIAFGVLVVVSMSFALVAAQRSGLTSLIDEALQVRSDDLARLARSGALPAQLPRGEDDDSIAQVVGPDGTVVASSANLAGSGALRPLPSGTVRLRRELDVDGVRLRVLSVLDDGHTIHTGTPTDDIEESVDALIGSLRFVAPGVALVAGALIWYVVGRALEPVEAIRRKVATISAENLHERVPVSGRDDEIDRLATTMNGLLDRAERTMDAQRRFVGDASHELRSPLGRLRARFEVESDRAGGTPDPLLRDSIDDVDRMGRLVDHLLLLAGVDAGASTRRLIEVDLDDVVLDPMRNADCTDRVVSLIGVGPARVVASQDDMERIVTNLLDNALRHAQHRVSVNLVDDSGTARLDVEDDGPGIAVEDRERVFERFVRLDDARTPGDGRHGLGLSIVRDLVERLGGEVSIGSGTSGGTRVSVALPVLSCESTTRPVLSQDRTSRADTEG